MSPETAEVSTLGCTLASFSLALTYVLSLYIWNSDLERDHPETIKRRFVSASSMLFLSPAFVYLFGSPALLAAHPIADLVGVRSRGFIAASLLPMVLTLALFLGPIAMLAASGTRFRLWLLPQYWQQCLRDLIWWRNHVVAPFTEEFTFRACMLPILLGCYSPAGAVVVSPLFFGTAHLHHMYERVRKGQDLRTAILISLFQMSYTTVFGMFSAFLFVRTGHLTAPVVVHGFCNFMGFPDFGELWSYKPRGRAVLVGLYLLGVVIFFKLLFPLTEPSLFHNTVYSW